MKIISSLLRTFFIFTLLAVCEGDVPKGACASTNDADGGIAQAQLISKAFQETSRAVLPSVVKIVVRSGNDSPRGGGSPLPFERFSHDFQSNRHSIEGVGSGVLIDPAGVVLTNHHVVSESKNIEVELFDGRIFRLRSMKKDPLSDLAVLVLDTDQTDLPSLTFADSDSLEIGDWVLAIGNPFMLDSSVSAGIVSAKGRSLSNKERGSFIQTDAAINPGNSGGPLVNLKGEIVGINTAIASLTGGYQGIGFAIPSNTAVWIKRQLIEKGRVERAFLGVPLETLSYEETQKLALPPRHGLKARTPFRDSPAAKAGLKSNDILIAFDGKPIKSLDELQSMVESAPVEREHRLTIRRKGESKPQELPIWLEIKPDGYVEIPQTENLVEQGRHFNDRAFGLMLLPLTDDAAVRLGLEGREGVVVLSVLPGSRAYRGGIRDGMLITHLGETRIESLADYESARQNLPLNADVVLEVIAKGETKSFTLSP